MAKIDKFAAPGNLKDLDGALADRWSKWVSDQLDHEVARVSSNAGIQCQFYNPSKLDVAGTAAPISWPAFPNIVEINFGDDEQRMFEEGERRDNQDEYLEWATTSVGDKITKVMFTCEGPEYWDFLARNAPDLLVKLYSQIAGQAVPERDLLTPAGAYIPRNKWNRAFAVHLIQRNNSLRAEINIAAQATILRKQAGQDPVTDPIALIQCSGFGAEERHSDPHIGDVVNQKSRQGCSITLQDPIGLYIAELPDPGSILGIRTPDGRPAGSNYWTLERGDAAHIVRAVFQVPPGETANGAPFVVGDMKVGGEPIRFGGQIVKAGMRIKLTGIVGKNGVFHNPTFSCPQPGILGLAINPVSRKG